MLPDLDYRMIPRGLCGLDGCVYTKGHTCDHSWMRPFDRPICRSNGKDADA